jgi:hypothetical protein
MSEGREEGMDTKEEWESEWAREGNGSNAGGEYDEGSNMVVIGS